MKVSKDFKEILVKYIIKKSNIIEDNFKNINKDEFIDIWLDDIKNEKEYESLKDELFSSFFGMINSEKETREEDLAEHNEMAHQYISNNIKLKCLQILKDECISELSLDNCKDESHVFIVINVWMEELDKDIKSFETTVKYAMMNNNN